MSTADIVASAVFLRGRALHQGTGRPLLGKVRVIAEDWRVGAWIQEDGRFALWGPTGDLFPALDRQDYAMAFRIVAASPEFQAGSAELLRNARIPSGGSFDPEPPVAARAPVDLGDCWFPADPVGVRGTVSKAEDPGVPVQGAQVELLHGGSAIPAVTTDSAGHYRLDGLVFVAPVSIRCTGPGRGTVQRPLPVDFTRLVTHQDIRLPPP